MSTQNSDEHDYSFSTLPSYSAAQRDNGEDPSFLFSQSNLFEEAGVLRKATQDAIPELTKIWMDERNAPEILPYERSLVEPLIDSIERQAEKIMEDMESENENKFESMVYQTEIERIKYLIKNYLRTRLFKIEKYTLHLLRQPNLKQLLSSQEIVYARRYQELIESHNHESFLHQLPKTQQKQDESSFDMNMVVAPNLDAPVFCRVLKNIGHVELNTNDGSDSVLLEENNIYILRYRDVQQYLQQGKVKLI